MTITVASGARGGNLDVLAELYDAAGRRVAMDNPPDDIGATLSATLPAGRYFLKIDGVGKGKPRDALAPGYSDYGSLGQYTFSGTIQEPTPLQVLKVAAIESVAGLVTPAACHVQRPAEPADIRGGQHPRDRPVGATVADPVVREGE